MRITLSAAVFVSLVGMASPANSHAGGPPAGRFDKLVRTDLFAGFNGNEKAMARGLKTCEDALAKNPKHVEALVWRGAARVFQAGQAFQANRVAEGMVLWTAGLKDMDDAIAIAPKSVGVRVPRAVVLIPAARAAPPAMGRPLLTKARDDLETIYKLQEPTFAKLGTHPRGELRMGLADVYRRVGEPAKSKEQLTAVIKELPDTKYAAQAKEWLAAPPTAALAHSCIGCHKN